MSIKTRSMPPGQALLIHSRVTPTEQRGASRVLARTAGGNLTLFAFDFVRMSCRCCGVTRPDGDARNSGPYSPRAALLPAVSDRAACAAS